MIKPVGHYVLIRIVVPEEVSEGGIIMAQQTLKKEENATEMGVIEAFGPTAYRGWPGCDSPNALAKAREDVGRQDPDSQTVEYWMWNDPDCPPYKAYGLDVGNLVEFRRYEGKKATQDKELRFIPDSHIIGVIDNE